jgi:hypothetical protein
MKKYLICIMLLAFIPTLGCQQKGTNEKAGERADEIIDNIKHGDAPLKNKGPIEKLGETIDDSVKETENKVN